MLKLMRMWDIYWECSVYFHKSHGLKSFLWTILSNVEHYKSDANGVGPIQHPCIILKQITILLESGYVSQL